MNKVININFQGRVIPIEEPAYEELKKYVESLRAHFANEEGREEIINDIENRIAELFNERLKSGQSFISVSDVEAIIVSMGRPEQFDTMGLESDESESSAGSQQSSYSYMREPRGSLYRNQNDKMIGGVCSGIGAYLKIDTTLVRVLFALLAFGAFGTGVVLYIVLWAILPARYIDKNIVARKLYRDAEQKVIGGVCSGIAHYFNIAVWIPRLIFALPLLLSAFEIPFTLIFFPFAAASFSSTIFLIYIILWVVVPKAVSASEKLEMKGQRVDLASIKNKVQDGLQEVKDVAQQFAKETGPAARSTGNAFLRFIATLFKIFIFFILGIVAIALIATLFGLGAAASVVMPLRSFIADGQLIYWYAWGTLILFIFVPIIAIVQWLIRAIIGHKTKSNVITITLGSLWILGWVCITLLVSTVSRQFKRSGSVKQEISLTQPANGRMKIQFNEAEGNYYPFDMNWGITINDESDSDDGVMLSNNEDSLLLSNIRIRLFKSSDTQFRATLIRRARGNTPADAERFAEKIDFSIDQQDSLLSIPIAFPITRETKFHNQQVSLELFVPVGKEIYIDRMAEDLSWYTLKSGGRGLNIQLDQNDEDEQDWRPGVWYIMTDNGLERKFKEEVEEDRILEKMKRKFERRMEREKDDNEAEEEVPEPPAPPRQQETVRSVTPSVESGRRLVLGALSLLKLGR
ncbi:MAG: PspC domain-containing protein [Chitinophagaceae bacterium]|jgi:phage shock protein PspC (stress-responsive transcriptional regulator)